MEPKVYGIGTKCIYDSFCGLITCNVIGFSEDRITVKITARKNSGYRNGEIVKVSGLHLFPKECFRRKGVFGFYTLPYRWEA